MSGAKWTFMLRLMKRDPDRIQMDRLGEYLRKFADLLGPENQPVFKGIKKASTGLKARVSDERVEATTKRLHLAQSDRSTRPGRALSEIEEMLGVDLIPRAQLLDHDEKVLFVLEGASAESEDSPKVQQEGSVDGVVVGLVGADDTMNLHLRDAFGHNIILIVRSEEMARDLLTWFRKGTVRLNVHGTWKRTEQGWVPEARRCTVDSFEVLDESPASAVLAALANDPDNGWAKMEDSLAEWRSIRGLH